MNTVESKWQELLSERELKEVQFAQVYAQDFHHGTTGHNQLMIINWLTDALNRVEQNGVDIQKLFHPQ